MNKPKQKTNDGCLWLFLVAIFSIIFFGVGKTFFGLNDLITISLSMALSMYLVSRWFGTPSIKSFLVNSFILFGMLITIKLVGNLIGGILSDLDPSQTNFKPKEAVAISTIVEGNDTISVYNSARSWRDNYGNSFSTSLTVRERDYRQLKNHLNDYVVVPSKNFWGDLYQHIDKKDGPSLDLIVKSFTEIGTQNKLNRREFAEMVVSCIQDIPYSFVFQEKCLPPSHYEKSIRDILKRCPECCIGNVAFGIQNPVSFLQNLKGDCDTRTVLIYSVLKQFGYDIAILNSDFYKHSIIGINLPSAGLHKKYRGKKYVVWETTNKYFELGYLSPSFNDITHWNVVLTSK